MSRGVISIRNLQLSYGRKKVLAGVDLELYPGKIYGLLGANGSGKSTLLRILAGALRPDSGEVAGKGVTGYVAQKFSLYEDLTVEENITFYGRCHAIPGRELAARVDGVLQRLGLLDLRRDTTSRLSHGWKQRVALAAALCHAPSLLLLDETTAGIDPVGRDALWKIFDECCRDGAAVLISTHHDNEAGRCDQIGFLQDGRLS